MCSASRLDAAQLRRACSPDAIPYETTAQAPGVGSEVVGQDRAVDALHFGIGIRRHGYNVFAVGPPGVGKQTLVHQFLHEQAAREEVSSDWCYVHDFDDTDHPRALELPAGVGVRLERDMVHAVTALRLAMRAAFESEEYRTRKQQIEGEFEKRREEALEEIRGRAKKRQIAVVQTSAGMAVAPMKEGVPVDPEKFGALPAEEQKRYHDDIESIGEEVEALLRKFHDWARSHHEAMLELRKQMAAVAAQRVFDTVRTNYPDLPDVLAHLDRIEKDVVESAEHFLNGSPGGVEAAIHKALEQDESDGSPFRRYRVNVLVDRTNEKGSPVVYEDNPSYTNLVGRVQHETRFGSLVANFTLIRAGAFHRAVGGYLILDARKIFQHPLAWEGIKRTIRSGEIRIESPGQALGLVPTVSLEPEPIPLAATKIVLTGDRLLYYLLSQLDPEFPELFKVLVDFEDSIDRTAETLPTYANLVATLVAKHGLRPFDRAAVARVIDEAARKAGDSEKLSVHMRSVVDLLQESDYRAGEAGRDTVTVEDVQASTDAQQYRSGRVQEHLQEAVRRETVLLSTSGSVTGQINGLAVFQLGERLFGHPTRITARVRFGKGEVLDIEREVSLGGPIHSKGVLILGGFLGARYAPEIPLSLAASLVFEQSYGGVDGDSASVAELCALLSALAEAPLDQSFAVTGSVNQHGQVQAIGGVNEKIEGFFDICRQRELTGQQGVVIPKANVKNLMLRQDVVDAVRAGKFHVHAIEHVDDAIELFTGSPAGARDDDGHFPEGTINGRVEARLIALAEKARSYVNRGGTEGAGAAKPP